jgi:predicted enzyme related to lactoylglutathione lyase
MRDILKKLDVRLVGVELYFDDPQQGKQFYSNVIGFELLDEEEGHYARFDAGESLVCLERRGSEPYPSRDKAVLFLEVSNLADAVRCIGEEKIVATKPPGEGRRRPWAALHDPEGYNIVLVEAASLPSSVQNAN